jgi:hypothetical protein
VKERLKERERESERMEKKRESERKKVIQNRQKGKMTDFYLMKCDGESQRKKKKKTIEQRSRSAKGHRKRNETVEEGVKVKRDLPALETNDRISRNVTHVNRATLDDDVRMLFGQQPADMRKEHTATTVVRISIGFREFVMQLRVGRKAIELDWIGLIGLVDVDRLT